jgi:DNA repair photolyase
MTKKFVSGTGEWASHSVNIQVGCPHNCLYGYCKANAIRFKKATSESWKTPVIDMEWVNKKRRKLSGVVMYPTQHDIDPNNITHSITVLKNLLEAGNQVLIVTKPHLKCVKAMCSALRAFKSHILFRFTIGSADDDVLNKWEPGASNFAERVKSLRWAYVCGFSTSVSCEPMLDQYIDKVIKVVKSGITDAIWLGKPNKIVARMVINNPDNPEAKKMAKELEALFTDEFVLDLYRKYKDDPIIKWKDSIKAVVGIERSTVKGLDK